MSLPKLGEVPEPDVLAVLPRRRRPEPETLEERQRQMRSAAVELAQEHGHPGGDAVCERFSCWILRQP